MPQSGMQVLSIPFIERLMAGFSKHDKLLPFDKLRVSGGGCLSRDNRKNLARKELLGNLGCPDSE